MAKKRKGRPEERPIWTRPDILFTEAGQVRIAGGSLSLSVGAGAAAPMAGGKKRSKPVTRASGGHYTPAQLAREWNLSVDKIREIFKNEPGVIRLKDDDWAKKRKRRYVTLRIPPEVAERVHRRIS